MARKKIYVLDTSVYLTDSNAISAFGVHDIVIPLKVLEEIDKHKKRQDGVGSNARRIIRTLDRLRSKGSVSNGVRIDRGKGILKATNFDLEVIPKEWSRSDSDNQIIATALTEKKLHPNRKVVVVSRDINMRVKCDSIGMACEGYEPTKVVKEASELYTGFKQHLVDDQFIDRFYEGDKKGGILSIIGWGIVFTSFLYLKCSGIEYVDGVKDYSSYSPNPLIVLPLIAGLYGIYLILRKGFRLAKQFENAED